MGKVKRDRQHRPAGNDNYGIPSALNKNGGVEKAKFQEIENNLNSLDEKKRMNACNLLSDLYSFNTSNKDKIYDIIATKKVLVKLNMRLVDNIDAVKEQASYALLYLSQVDDEDIVQKLISVGIMRSVITSVMQYTNFETTVQANTFQNFLEIICNIITNDTNAMQEVLQSFAGLNTYLINVLTTLINENAAKYANILIAILDFYIVAMQHGHQHEAINRSILPHNTMIEPFFQSLLDKKGLVDLFNTSKALSSWDIDTDESYWLLVSKLSEFMLTSHVTSAYQGQSNNTITKSTSVVKLLLNGLVSLFTLANSIATTESKEETQEMMTEGNNMSVQEEEQMITNLNERDVSNTAKTTNDTEVTRKSSESILDVTVNIAEVLSSWITFLLPSDDEMISTNTRQGLSYIIEVNQYCQVLSQLYQLLPSIRTAFFQSGMIQEAYQNSEKVDIQLILINNIGVQWWKAVEKVTQAIHDNLLVIQRAELTVNADGFSSTSNILTYTSAQEHCAFLFESVQNITSVMNNDTKKAEESWKVTNSENLSLLKHYVISSSSTFLDILTLSLRRSQHIVYVAGNIDVQAVLQIKNNSIKVLTEDDTKQLINNTLRCLSQTPYLEISLSVVQLVIHLAAMQGYLDPLVPELRPFPVKYHQLLTNSLMSRLQNPAAFAYDQHNTSSSITKNDNVQRSTLLVIDSCINAIIDLHSSDEVDYHQAFTKLAVGPKLTAAKDDTQRKLHASSKNRSLSADEMEVIQETLMNLENFLIYKSNFSI